MILEIVMVGIIALMIFAGFAWLTIRSFFATGDLPRHDQDGEDEYESH